MTDESKEYETLLTRAYANLPEKALTKERYELPRAEIQMEGNKTIITNFKELCDKFRRKPDHFLKFVSKELAVPANAEGTRAILKSRVPPRLLNEKVQNYVKEFILCHECGKPDTNILDEKGVSQLKCEVCGAKTPIRKLK